MKKKLGLIFICSVILFGVCGCGNKNSDIDKNEDTLISQLKCDAFDNVKYSFDNYFITNNNDLYIFNTNQLYSNNENCKKINNNEKIIKLMVANSLTNSYYEYYALDNTNNIYYINNDKLILYTDLNNENYDVPVFKTFVENDVISQYTYFALKNDGSLYWYEEIYQNQDINKLVLFRKYDNESILEYNIIISGQGYIKTDKAFYTTKIINQEQCEKYADIECQYDIVKNKKLTNIYNNISIYRLDSTYITKDGKMYQLNN